MNALDYIFSVTRIDMSLDPADTSRWATSSGNDCRDTVAGQRPSSVKHRLKPIPQAVESAWAIRVGQRLYEATFSIEV
jgi:hypothetical protein